MEHLQTNLPHHPIPVILLDHDSTEERQVTGLMSALRANSNICHIPVFALTSQTDVSATKALHRCALQGYFKRSLIGNDTDEFFTIVAHHINVQTAD